MGDSRDLWVGEVVFLYLRSQILNHNKGTKGSGIRCTAQVLEQTTIRGVCQSVPACNDRFLSDIFVVFDSWQWTFSCWIKPVPFRLGQGNLEHKCFECWRNYFWRENDGQELGFLLNKRKKCRALEQKCGRHFVSFWQLPMRFYLMDSTSSRTAMTTKFGI